MMSPRPPAARIARHIPGRAATATSSTSNPTAANRAEAQEIAMTTNTNTAAAAATTTTAAPAASPYAAMKEKIANIEALRAAADSRRDSLLTAVGMTWNELLIEINGVSNALRNVAVAEALFASEVRVKGMKNVKPLDPITGEVIRKIRTAEEKAAAAQKRVAKKAAAATKATTVVASKVEAARKADKK